MSDVQDLPEPQAVSTTELVNLLVNATESCSSQPTQFNHNSSENNGLGLGALFGAESEEDSGHSADGNEFHPTAERGWTADWTPLSLSQIAVDSFIDVCCGTCFVLSSVTCCPGTGSPFLFTEHTDPELITEYKHHLQSYLQTSVFMFGNEVIAPNHHMAIHLAECLDKFGPVRSWVLLESDRLPDDLKRFIT
ncbi:hypothetical protein PSTT_14210 [Puccinia striiformis]|uniref:Uncharacterized protein n=1 Tax=Puccinia striiformis TaxID=27350 RepID=A0A2S4UN65_9BASI|nr:hypothetical protein PSTT_14210 [Puccinia striiformis]